MEKATKEVILIADDLPNNLAVLQDYLIESGFEVLAALDGESAIQQAEYAQPDLILLDVLMPGMTGFETCLHLKANQATHNIPIIFVTSLADTEDKVKGFEAGAVDYITKPIKKQELLARVKTHLNLQNLQKQLQLQNQLLQQEIGVRLQVEEALKQRTAQLEAVNQELDAFGHSVAHDLRSSITSINGFNYFLEKEYSQLLSDTGQHYTRRVRQATMQMEELIEGLMLLSQVKGSKMLFEDVNLSKIASETIAQLQQAHPERKVEFIYSENVSAFGDTRLLRILLENLLGNSWKYTAKNPLARIEFGAMQNEQQSQEIFFVRDNGAGFNMAYASKLFSAFQRLHHKSDFPGSGIGLATVKRIIDRHNGHIWAEAVENKGATFYFTISP
ncbi:hybrid sensor histidine kinase/response regulator [Dulcicalothrix desertica PCC 7102]|uniref:histidine kinase n=1 Tax=Dulcicalothrix desertica PCC 7102 TaxID=232991 RepID=A0A3S1AV06_9CYAN|nr:response regulator [Dulcicalothrix desertica]RUT09696.1 hybrid sensor histidine kinase/response regulator [Dulcicalothrix desertica PCC 7102]TWH50894.1 hypothetical protein CAL7102_05241 [Dulcicalothrix desertica PCC 7102]